jgi:hypothetical protein
MDTEWEHLGLRVDHPLTSIVGLKKEYIYNSTLPLHLQGRLYGEFTYRFEKSVIFV